MTFEINYPDTEESLAKEASTPQTQIDYPDKVITPHPLSESYQEVSPIAPDQAAKVLNIANKTGLEVPYVGENINEAEKAYNTPTDAYWNQLTNEAPRTAKMLEDRSLMATARDDLDNLSLFEKIILNASFGLASGDLQIEQAKLRMQQGLNTLTSGKRDYTGEDRLQQIDKMLEIDQLRAPSSKLSDISPSSIAYFTGQQIPNLIEVAKHSAIGGVTGAIAGGAGAAALTASATAVGGPIGYVASLIGTSAAAGAGARFGGRIGVAAGALEATALLEGGNSLDDYLKLKDENGNPVDPVLATTAAFAVGAVNAGLETFALSKIPGMGRVVNFIKGNPEIFQKLTKGIVIKNAVKALLESGIAETTTEVLQQGSQILGREASKALSNGKFPETKSEDVINELMSVVSPTLQSVIPIGIPGTAHTFVHGFHNAQLARHNEQVYTAMVNNAEGSKLLKRSPDQYEKATSEQVKDTPYENIYIPAQQMETYFQEKQIPIDSVLAELGVDKKDFEQQKESGGDVKISTATWLTKAAGTEHALGLAKDIKTDENGLTPRQVEQQDQEQQKAIEEEAKRVDELVNVKGEEEAARKPVVDYITEQLKNAGVKSNKEIDASVKLYAAHVSVMAKEAGQSIEEYFQGPNKPVITKDGQVIQGESFNQDAFQSPAFYSKLEKTIQDKMPSNAPVAQVRGLLKEVKPEEMQYSGVEDFLAGKDKVNKEELVNFLQDNQIQVNTIEKGFKGQGALNFGEQGTKFHSYTLPGGKNYREVLFTLPIKDKPYDKKKWQELYKKYKEELKGEVKDSELDFEAKLKADDYFINKESSYQSPHFNEPNILAHIRLNDRVDSEGKRVLFVEEIQSDLHQEGRKKGYKENLSESEQKEFKELEENFGTLTQKERDRYYELKKEGAVPNLPFKKSWQEFAFKRILDEAVRKGYDKVAWTTGDQQAERYDLSKQVDAIEYTKKDNKYYLSIIKDGGDITDRVPNLPNGIEEKQLADYVGKDVAEKIVRGEGDSIKLTDAPFVLYDTKNQSISGEYDTLQEAKNSSLALGEERFKAIPSNEIPATNKSLSGVNLKVGGEGMKGFYDKILPDFVNKYTKKWGGKVEGVTIQGKEFHESILVFSEENTKKLDGIAKEIGELRKKKNEIDQRNRKVKYAYRQDEIRAINEEINKLREERNNLPEDKQGSIEKKIDNLSGEIDSISEGINKKFPTQTKESEEILDKIRKLHSEQESIKPEKTQTHEENNVHSLTITPQMRDSILKEGQTLFQSRRRRAEGKQWEQKRIPLPETFETVKISDRMSYPLNDHDQLEKIIREKFSKLKDKVDNKHTRREFLINETTVEKFISVVVGKNVKDENGNMVFIPSNLPSYTKLNFLRILTKLDEVLQKGIYLEDGTDEKDKGREFRYLSTDTKINGHNFIVQLAVDRRTMGLYNIKSFEITDKELAGRAYNEAKPEGQLQVAFHPADNNIALFKEKINWVKANYAHYQGNPENPRGSVMFGGDHPIISLFQSKDVSTFMHESAHIWAKEIHDLVKAGTASESQMRDWGILKEWLGYDDDQTNFTTEQQEKFANGFLAYLREGEAPSEGLRKAFSSFSKWLTNLYQSIKGTELDVGLNDEVRGVFDRMLASEKEIEEAKASLEIKDLIDPELAKTLSPEVVQKLKDFQEKANEQAVSKLLKPQMQELTEEYKKKIEEERTKGLDLIRAEVAQVPIYKSIENLERFLEERNKRIKPKELAGRFMAGALNDYDRTLFEIFAESDGYSSGAQLASLIMSNPDFNTEVNNRLKNYMLQFSDLKDSARIKDEALKALHSEKQSELIALELQILNDLARKGQEKQNNIAKMSINIDVVKSKAKSILENKSIKDASNFRVYFTAEKNAAVNSAKALKEKDYTKAGEWKQKQLVNHVLAREAIKISKEVDSAKKYLTKIQRKDKASFKDERHFMQVANLLERFGYAREDYNNQLRTESLSEWIKRMDEENMVLSEKEEAAGVQVAVNRAYVDIADWLTNEDMSKVFNQLTTDEMNNVTDAIKNIIHVANYEDKAYAIFDGMKISDITSKLIEAAKANIPEAKKKKEFQHAKRIFPFSNQYTTTVEKGVDQTAKTNSRFLFGLKKIQTIFHTLDNFTDGVFTKLWEATYHAANKESDLLVPLDKRMKEIFNAYDKKERTRMVGELNFDEDLGDSFTKMDYMVMALNRGNEGNWQKLISTRPIGVNENVNWNEQTILKVLEKKLDRRDWNTVQNIWDLVNSLWPELSKTHQELTGFTPDKVEARAFKVNLKDKQGIIREETYHGGYWPLVQDPRGSFLTEQRIEADDPLFESKVPNLKAATKQNHAKKRTGAQYPIKLSIDTLSNHLHAVVHDIAFRGTVIDLRRIFGRKEFQQAIKEAIGSEGHAMIQQWLHVVAGTDKKGSAVKTGIELYVNYARRKMSFGVIALKARVIVQNFANPFLFPNRVDGFGYKDALTSYIRYGLLDYMPTVFLKNGREIREFVHSKSAFMRDRFKTPDFTLREACDELFGADSALSKFSQTLLAGSDDLTNIPMWLGAYNKKLEEGVEEKEAILYADKLIDRTMGSGRKQDLASIIRGNEFEKTMTMFYSFMNNVTNAWMVETGRVKSVKDVPRLTAFAATQLLFVIASTALMGKTDDDDDEKKKKQYFAEVLKYPATLFPLVRDIVPPLIDYSLELNSFGYRISPLVGAGELAYNVGKTAVKAVKGDATVAESVEAAARAYSILGPFVKYPDQFNIWLFNLYDIAFNHMEPKKEDFLARRSKNER